MTHPDPPFRCRPAPSRPSRWVLCVAGLACLGATWTMPAPAEAQHSSSQLRSSSQQGSSAGRYRAQGRYRGAQQTPQRQSANHHLRSPMGSAANVGQGYYHHRMSQPQQPPGVVHPNPYPPYYGGYGPGYVVYVDTYGGEPQIYGQAERPAAEAAPVIVQPPPVYIIQPPAPGGTGSVDGASAFPGQRTGAYDPSTYDPSSFDPNRGTTAPAEPAAPPRPSEPQAVTFHIEPADARVYLDDSLLGTAGQVLARSPLILDPGVYLLAVEHPDFGVQRLFFGVDGATPTSVGVDLTTDHPRHRTRVD